jgi:hypothetical protein
VLVSISTWPIFTTALGCPTDRRISARNRAVNSESSNGLVR